MSCVFFPVLVKVSLYFVSQYSQVIGIANSVIQQLWTNIQTISQTTIQLSPIIDPDSPIINQGPPMIKCLKK